MDMADRILEYAFVVCYWVLRIALIVLPLLGLMYAATLGEVALINLATGMELSPTSTRLFIYGLLTIAATLGAGLLALTAYFLFRNTSENIVRFAPSVIIFSFAVFASAFVIICIPIGAGVLIAPFFLTEQRSDFSGVVQNAAFGTIAIIIIFGGWYLFSRIGAIVTGYAIGWGRGGRTVSDGSAVGITAVLALLVVIGMLAGQAATQEAVVPHTLSIAAYCFCASVLIALLILLPMRNLISSLPISIGVPSVFFVPSRLLSHFYSLLDWQLVMPFYSRSILAWSARRFVVIAAALASFDSALDWIYRYITLPINPDFISLVIISILLIVSVQTILTLLRRLAWISKDLVRFELYEEVEDRSEFLSKKVGLDNDERPALLLSVGVFFLVIVPLALRQTNEVAPLFQFDGNTQAGYLDWLSFVGGQFLRAVPLVDWAEAYGFATYEKVTATYFGKHVVFALRVLIDLALISAVLESVRHSLRLAETNRRFLDPDDVLDSLTPREEKNRMRRIARSWDAVESFPRYDPDRLVLLQDDYGLSGKGAARLTGYQLVKKPILNVLNLVLAKQRRVSNSEAQDAFEIWGLGPVSHASAVAEGVRRRLAKHPFLENDELNMLAMALDRDKAVSVSNVEAIIRSIDFIDGLSPVLTSSDVLEWGEPRRRLDAAHKLGALASSHAKGALRYFIGSQDISTARSAIRAIERTTGNGDAEYLLKRLGNPELRHAVIMALSECPSETARAQLLDLVVNCVDRATGKAAAYYFARHPGNDVIDIVPKLIGSRKSHARINGYYLIAALQLECFRTHVVEAVDKLLAARGEVRFLLDKVRRRDEIQALLWAFVNLASEQDITLLERMIDGGGSFAYSEFMDISAVVGFAFQASEKPDEKTSSILEELHADYQMKNIDVMKMALEGVGRCRRFRDLNRDWLSTRLKYQPGSDTEELEYSLQAWYYSRVGWPLDRTVWEAARWSKSSFVRLMAARQDTVI